jgi:hypothetical protein
MNADFYMDLSALIRGHFLLDYNFRYIIKAFVKPFSLC